MEKKDKTKIAVSAFLATLFVAVIGSLLNQGDSKATSENKRNSSLDDGSSFSSEVEQKKLSVSPDRCSGCGKCVRIDSEHFAIDAYSRKATIISQKNLDSTGLTSAVSMCHDGAIALS